MKFKRYETVEDLLAHSLPNSKDVIKNMNRMFREDAMSRHLFFLRSQAGVSQLEMARRLGVSQSVISKMENKGDYLKFNEVIRYLNALGFSAEFASIKHGKAVDFLASYFGRIKAVMDELQELAGDDQDITDGIMTAFLMFSKSMLEDVIPKIKGKKPNSAPALKISLTPERPKAGIAHKRRQIRRAKSDGQKTGGRRPVAP